MIIKINDTKYDCSLVDDGTLDTVININGYAVRYDQDYAAQYRKSTGTMTVKGFKELCIEAINDSDLDFNAINA